MNKLFNTNKEYSTLLNQFLMQGALSLSSDKYVIIPGLCDVHVHLREPGFSYKETIYTGSRACARGGYTTVFSMPNLNPVPDTIDNLNIQLDIINKDAIIEVIPYGSITKNQQGNELSDMEDLVNKVCAFSDDGRGVQNEDMMEKAMLKAKSLGKIIVAHCEDNSLFNGGYIHKGTYAKEHGHLGICSESEYLQVQRDLELVRKTGVKYHVCHISTKESVDLIRKAKKEGLDVTCETAPHYLILSDKDLKEEGRFKMNPPLRDESDRLALIEGVLDGTIDMIATDHAPHSLEEKSKGLKGSAFGITGIETAFPLLYTYLVKTGIIDLDKLVTLLSVNPRKRFNVKDNGYSVFEIKTPYKIDENKFISKGKSTPFSNVEVYGKCVLTVMNGKPVYEE